MDKKTSWKRLCFKACRWVVGLTAATLVAIAIENYYGRARASTYLQLNWRSLIALGIVSVVGLAFCAFICAFTVDSLLYNHRFLLRAWRKIGRSGPRINITKGELRTIFWMRIAWVAAIMLGVAYLAILPLVTSGAEHWRSNWSSYTHIRTAERLMFNTEWMVPDDIAPWTGTLTRVQGGSGMQTAVDQYRHPRTCATFVSPNDPNDVSYNFGFQFESNSGDQAVRVVVRSDVSTYSSVRQGGDWTGNQSALVFHALDPDLVNLRAGHRTNLCAIVDDDYVYLFANDELLRAFAHTLGANPLNVSVVFNIFRTDDAGSAATLQVENFLVQYQEMDDRIGPGTPTDAPATPGEIDRQRITAARRRARIGARAAITRRR